MDEKKLKALAAELAKGLKTEADLNQFSRMLTKLTVETALNAELTDHLGHEKNDTGKTVLKNQTADGLYYAVRYLSYMASATVRPEQEASPQWQPGEATRWDAGLLAGS